MQLPSFLFRALVLPILLMTPPASAETVLRFGVYTSDKASDMVRQFRPLMNAIEQGLQERTGTPVRVSMQVASNYEKGIEDLVEGRVDFSRFGPASYVMAKRANPEVRLLAMESKNGGKRFKGLIVVHADSAYQSVGELRGARFAFGDPRSTIGRYLVQKYLVEHGVYSGDLASYHFLGRHDAVARAVAAGNFDAGAVKSRTLQKAVKAGVPLRELASFENVTKPWITRAGMEDELYGALRDTLLGIKDSEGLKGLGKEGFLPGDDSEYDFIRQAMTASAAFEN